MKHNIKQLRQMKLLTIHFARKIIGVSKKKKIKKHLGNLQENFKVNPNKDLGKFQL